MATIKAYTDIPQSKKLAEILSLESADMYYLIKRNDCRVPWEEAAKDDTNVILFPKKMMSGNLSDYKLPAWSLAALLEQMPSDIKGHELTIRKSYWQIEKTFAYELSYEEDFEDYPPSI